MWLLSRFQILKSQHRNTTLIANTFIKEATQLIIWVPIVQSNDLTNLTSKEGFQFLNLQTQVQPPLYGSTTVRTQAMTS